MSTLKRVHRFGATLRKRLKPFMEAPYNIATELGHWFLPENFPKTHKYQQIDYYTGERKSPDIPGVTEYWLCFYAYP